MNGVIVALFLIMILPELPGLLHRRHAREWVLFAVLWVAGLAISLAITNGINTDGVTQALRRVFEPIGKLVIIPPPD